MVARSLCAREKNEYETGRRNRMRQRVRGGGGGGGRIEGRYTEGTKTLGAFRARVSVCMCMWMYVCTRVCVHEMDSVQGRRAKSTREVDTDRQAERNGERNRERERDVAKQRPSPISILIELNATSYLMPETRQKLQLNGDAISLYLLVHSS